MMCEDGWPWPNWDDAPAWANCVTQDSDGMIRWWMHPPSRGSRRWLHTNHNRMKLAMVGHPNTWWEYAMEMRSEGFEREAAEAKGEKE